MFPILAADIGGTHSRFALAKKSETHPFGVELSNLQTYNTSSFNDVVDGITLYVSTLTELPKNICLAVAGPVVDDTVVLTNRDMHLSIQDISFRFGFSTVSVINDYAAVAYASTRLGKDCFDVIKPGVVDQAQTRVVVGAGTGLGASALISMGGSWHAIASEVGHTSLFGSNEKERQILCNLASEQGYLTAETLISGPGIVVLYQAIAADKNVTANKSNSKEILLAGLEYEDEICVETVNMVCNLLGSFVGDLALTFCARGGVYLAGSIFKTLAPHLKESDFTTHFVNKGAISKFVEEIPVYIIQSSQPGLYGAAIRALYPPEN